MPSERQVEFMKRSSLGKVILLLVEGHSDVTTLELALSNVVESKSYCSLSEPYHVDTIESGIGDVTSKYDNNHTVVERVGNAVNSFINAKRSSRPKITLNDLAGIIHVIDTDGTFIPNDNLYEDDVDSFIYKDDGIYGRNRQSIISRNTLKSESMIRLSNTPRIKGIPYKTYFMSCNLDHVTCNDRNLDDKMKETIADSFHDKFKNDIHGFVDFFNQSDLVLGSNYKESWELIQKGMNSINRHSNLNLFINDPFGQLSIL